MTTEQPKTERPLERTVVRVISMITAQPDSVAVFRNTDDSHADPHGETMPRI